MAKFDGRFGWHVKLTPTKKHDRENMVRQENGGFYVRARQAGLGSLW